VRGPPPTDPIWYGSCWAAELGQAEVAAVICSSRWASTGHARRANKDELDATERAKKIMDA
jgi:hypothetical protein